MRLISTIIAIIAFPTIAFASSFNGPYIGIQGGYESFNIDSTLVGAGALAGDSANTTFGGDGLNGGIFAGYGQKMGSTYLGIELEADAGGASSKNSIKVGGTTAEADASHQYDLGASIRAGYFLNNDTMLYGRVGGVNSKFNTNGTTNPSFNGVRFGFGSETAISSNITIRADWSYTDYQSKSWSDSSGDKLTVSPTSNTFRVGLAYNF